MKPARWIELVGALALIAAGLVFLLGNLGLIPNPSAFFWAVLFVAGGAVFLATFVTDRQRWWALIPGAALLGVGSAIVLGVLGAGAISGAVIFLFLAAAFLAIYLLQRRDNWWALIPGGATAVLALVTLLGETAGFWAGVVFFTGFGAGFVVLYFIEIDGRRHNWWALIPAGALFSLALVVLLAGLGAGGAAGASLFLGLAATFGVLYLMSSPERPLQWAWIPAVALLAFGLFILAVAGNTRYERYVTSIALIAAGLVLLAAYLLRRGGAPQR